MSWYPDGGLRPRHAYDWVDGGGMGGGSGRAGAQEEPAAEPEPAAELHVTRTGAERANSFCTRNGEGDRDGATEPACEKFWDLMTPNEQAAAALCAAHLPIRLLALLRQPVCCRLVLALAARAFRLTFALDAVSISGSGGNQRTRGMVLPTRLARRFNASTRQ